MKVRKATEQDSSAIVDVLIKSITEGCQLDHQNRSEVLAKWLHNKTVSNVTAWINNLDNITLVALDNISEQIVGVGLITKSGQLKLLYVLPDQQRKGVGAQLLSHLEVTARNLGIETISLDSTRTAYKFYEKHNYVPTGKPFVSSHLLTCYPMIKEILTS